MDSDDIWKVTSRLAIRPIREAGEWQQAENDLVEHWEHFRMTDTDREYESTVEQLLERGAIKETAYWYCCPFPSVYRVGKTPVHVLGQEIPSGYAFVYEYGDDGAPAQFIVRPTFGEADSRKYCDD
ncbi:hypothetical protein [Paenibacillus cymbidii]|uniref:hypothetical protein n=1 Tax=Paenibacillus cymbidii TaxID=1639034 RepID=UPI0010816AD5|nr:hypothetical protein [Paenibacillus cymbidii]